MKNRKSLIVALAIALIALPAAALATTSLISSDQGVDDEVDTTGGLEDLVPSGAPSDEAGDDDDLVGSVDDDLSDADDVGSVVGDDDEADDDEAGDDESDDTDDEDSDDSDD
jgi:TATA-binding protein-associated factor Taf7